ncbi:MAG: hypothetical protein KZQ92_00460 [Candidatus Thiodiazotropha sp. (ex Lucinoma borealis)]|nr:hypothetical protein [Candidatus Thiodiazotropha sp. (ex Lucinoma borealis)]
MTAKLDKTLLEVEYQLVETVSLLTALETADFDLDTTPSGVAVDTGAWSDVMAILRKQVEASCNKLEPYCIEARDRTQGEVESEEEQS